jgi:hypothetical protein
MAIARIVKPRHIVPPGGIPLRLGDGAIPTSCFAECYAITARNSPQSGGVVSELDVFGLDKVLRIPAFVLQVSVSCALLIARPGA